MKISKCHRCGRAVTPPTRKAHDRNCSKLTQPMETIKADCERIGILFAAKLYGVTKQFLYGHIKALEPEWWAAHQEAQRAEVPCDICDRTCTKREYPKHRRFCKSMPTPEETIKALQEFGIKAGAARLCITPAQARERVKRKYRAELNRISPQKPKNKRKVENPAPTPLEKAGKVCQCGVLFSSAEGQRGDGVRCGLCADEAAGIVRRPKVWTSDGIGMVRLMW